jgi:drug/metabolite transporter superfamily protein YnfA
MSEQQPNQFERAGTEQIRGGFFRELWGFMRQNKKWWLLPIVLVLLLLGALIMLSGSVLAPFIYTLF